MLDKFPPTFVVGYRLYARMTFMLPHDKSYLVLPQIMTKKEGTILDIGANVGISSAYFQKIRPDWKIIAFEPNVIHQSQLERLKRINKNFSYHLVGLSDKSDVKMFYTPTYYGIPLHCETKSRSIDINSLRNYYYKFVVDKIKFVKFEVPVRTIDELNLHPSVIKIDCEGDDFIIVKGGVNTIERCRPCILLEGNSETYDDMVAFFKKLNMGVYFYDYKKNKLIQSELALVRDENNYRNLVVIPAEKIGEIPSLM